MDSVVAYRVHVENQNSPLMFLNEQGRYCEAAPQAEELLLSNDYEERESHFFSSVLYVRLSIL